MKDLKAIRGRSYILDLIHQGEHVQQDFKYAISDARKIARSISAFANNMGGRLLVGVKDNGVIAGVRNEEDIYVIEQAAELYCKPAQQIEFTAFSTGECGVVIRASVTRAPQRPVMAQEPDRKWRAYFRVADENIAAHPLMVRAWQQQSSDRRTVIRSDGAETAIIRALECESRLPLVKAILASGASKNAAEGAIVRLAASGLVGFEYVDGQFVLTLTE